MKKKFVLLLTLILILVSVSVNASAYYYAYGETSNENYNNMSWWEYGVTNTSYYDDDFTRNNCMRYLQSATSSEDFNNMFTTVGPTPDLSIVGVQALRNQTHVFRLPGLSTGTFSYGSKVYETNGIEYKYSGGYLIDSYPVYGYWTFQAVGIVTLE